MIKFVNSIIQKWLTTAKVCTWTAMLILIALRDFGVITANVQSIAHTITSAVNICRDILMNFVFVIIIAKLVI